MTTAIMTKVTWIVIFDEDSDFFDAGVEYKVSHREDEEPDFNNFDVLIPLISGFTWRPVREDAGSFTVFKVTTKTTVEEKSQLLFRK